MQPELASILKRVTTSILNKQGILRQINNLGHHPTPFKISSKGLVHREANYFMFLFDIQTNALGEIKGEYKRDVDIVRHTFFLKNKDRSFDCKLDAEIQPPAYREDVKEMIKKGKTQQNPFTKKFRYNSGLTYYPFQK